MKAALLIVITVLFFSCSPKEPSVSKLLEDYIKLTVDNANTYESVETRPAKSLDLLNSPEIRGQFVNVEKLVARISYTLEDIHEYFRLYLPDSTSQQIIDVILIFNRNAHFSFEILDVYMDKVVGLGVDSITLPNSAASYNRRLLQENKALYESALSSIKTEYSKLYRVIQENIGFAEYIDLHSGIESAELMFHTYNIEQNGSVNLEGGLFLVKDLQVIRSMPIEVE